MGELTYLLLSILCAVLQHEILASPSGRASSSGVILPPIIIRGPTPPEYAQGIRDMYMDNPTKVNIISTDTEGHFIRKTGWGWAVHPYFVAVRLEALGKGCKVESFQGDGVKHFDIEGIIPGPKAKIFLLRTRELILLDNGHRVKDGFEKDEYEPKEYEWIKFIVGEWIKEHTLPIRHYRGKED